MGEFFCVHVDIYYADHSFVSWIILLLILCTGGRCEKIALNLEDVRCVVRFVLNYAEQHAIILPGRISGFKRDDIKALPSSISKAELHRCYSKSVKDGDRVVGLSSFYKLWRQLMPYVVKAKPAADLCWICQQNNYLT